MDIERDANSDEASLLNGGLVGKQLPRKLDRAIETHRGFPQRHPFFARCRNERGGVDKDAVRAFGRDYHYFIDAFPRCLASLASAPVDAKSRAVLSQILYEETGAGTPDESHAALFGQILRSLGMTSEELALRPKFDETTSLVSGMVHLYGHEDVLQALGAQYALEKQAVGMIEDMALAFQRIHPGPMPYFTVHMDAEPNHHQWMKDCLLGFASEPDEFDRVEKGAIELLDLLENFWDRLAEVCETPRQSTATPLPQTRPPQDGAAAVQMEISVLRLLLNAAERYQPLPIDSPALAAINPRLPTVVDVADCIHAIIEEYAVQIVPPGARVYFAYKLPSPLRGRADGGGELVEAHYRFGVSCSSAGSWRPGQYVAQRSNIAYVYEQATARYHRDTSRIAAELNQRLRDELCVYNFPIAANRHIVGVLGFSSPEVAGLEHSSPACRAIASYIEEVLYHYTRKVLVDPAELARDLRKSLAEHYEGTLPA